MTARALHPGTEVEVDIRGRVFTAVVTGRPADGRFPIKPRAKGVGYFSAKASQVKRVLHRGDGQLQLGASS